MRNRRVEISVRQRRIRLWWIICGSLCAFMVNYTAMADNKKQPEIKKDPVKEILMESFDKMEKKSKGYHFKGKRETNFITPDMKMNIPTTFEGVRQIADKPEDTLTYMTFQNTIRGTVQKYEMYQKGTDKTYFKNLDSGDRIRGKVKPPQSEMETMKETLKNYRLDKEEKISDTVYTVIEADIDEKTADRIMAEQPSMLKMPQDAKYECLAFKALIDKKEKVLRKISFSIQITGGEGKQKISRQILLEAEFFDYDKNVEIKLPDVVKRVFAGEKDSNIKPLD